MIKAIDFTIASMAEHSDPHLAGSPSGSPSASAGSRQALLIGVPRYVEGWQPLPAAQGDVESLRQLLLDPEIGKFDDARLLLNPERQPIEAEINALVATSKFGDLLLLYISGYGLQDEDGKLYIAAATTRKDSQGKPIKPTAVLLNTIQEILDRSPAQQVVILDCCFERRSRKGFDLSSAEGGGATSSSYAAEWSDIQAQLGGENRAILTAANSTDYSPAQKQDSHSLYTSHLLEAIRVGAANRSAQITVTDLHRYVSRRVQAEAPAILPQLYLPHADFDIALTNAPPLDAKLSYRHEVEHRSHGEGEISDFDRLILNWRRDRLGLSPDTTQEVEQAVLKPHSQRQQKLQTYQEKLTKVAGYQYPLSPVTLQGLEQLRRRLGLLQDQTEPIAATVLMPYNSQYQQHLQQYQQHFSRELERHYPPDRHLRNELRYLEQQLRLEPDDIAGTKQQTIAMHQEYRAEPLADSIQNNGDPSRPRPNDYPQKLQQYRQFFFDHLPPDQPLDESALTELASMQQVLQLVDADVFRAEEEATQQKRKDYSQKLQDYQQEAMRMAEARSTGEARSETIDPPATRAALKPLQQQLGLADADADRAEKIALELNDLPTAPAEATQPPVELSLEAPMLASGVVTAPQAHRADSPPDIAPQPSRERLQERIADSPLPDEVLERDRYPEDAIPVTAQPVMTLPPSDAPLPRREAVKVLNDPRPLQVRLRDRQYLTGVALQTLKSIGLAVLAILGSRLLITALQSLLPGVVGQALGIVIFLLSLLLAWQLMNL